MLDNPNILFLHRIFKRDCICIENELEDKLLEDIDKSETNIEANNYDTIPDKFTTLNEWKKKTELLCWACDVKFNTVPVFVPEYLIETSPGNILMKVLGNFCDFPCASQYNNTYTTGRRKWERQQLLLKLYKIFYGDEISEIPPSPSKIKMVQYGGFLTREQYDDVIALSMEQHKKTMGENSIESIEVSEY